MFATILSQSDTSTLPTVLVVSSHVDGKRQDYVCEPPKHLKDLPPGFAFLPYKLTCIGRINTDVKQIEFWPCQTPEPPLEQMSDIVWMISFISIQRADSLRLFPNRPPSVFEINQIQVPESCFNHMLLGLTANNPRLFSNVIVVGKSLVSALTSNSDKLICPHCGSKLYMHTPYVRHVDVPSDHTARAGKPPCCFIYDENSNTIQIPYEVPRMMCSSCEKKVKSCPEVQRRKNNKYLTYALFDPNIFIPYVPYTTSLLTPEFLDALKEMTDCRMAAMAQQLLKLLTHLTLVFKEMAISQFRTTVIQQHLLSAAATHAEIDSLDLKLPVICAGIVFSATYQVLARGEPRFSTEVFWGEKGVSLLYELLNKYAFYEEAVNNYEEEKTHPPRA